MDGKQLERLTINMIQRNHYFDITDTTDSRLDIEEGTDLIVHTRYRDYRVDVTLDFQGKVDWSSTESLGAIGVHDDGLFLTVDYGYRTDNGFSRFPQPVLVVGITDTSRDLIHEHSYAIEAYERSLYHIIEKGISAFNNYELIPSIMKDPLKIGDLPASVQTCEMCDIAIEHASKEEALELVDCLADVTESQQLRLVQKNGLTIDYFYQPSETVQLAAIEENSKAFHYINAPSAAAERLYALLTEKQAAALLPESKVLDDNMPLEDMLASAKETLSSIQAYPIPVAGDEAVR